MVRSVWIQACDSGGVSCHAFVHVCGSRLEQWAHATGGFTSMFVFGADRRLAMMTGTDLLKDAMFVFEGDFVAPWRLGPSPFVSLLKDRVRVPATTD